MSSTCALPLKYGRSNPVEGFDTEKWTTRWTPAPTGVVLSAGEVGRGPLAKVPLEVQPCDTMPRDRYRAS